MFTVTMFYKHNNKKLNKHQVNLSLLALQLTHQNQTSQQLPDIYVTTEISWYRLI